MFVLPEHKSDFRSFVGLEDKIGFRRAEAGQYLFQQDQSQKWFVFIRSGMAKVTRMSADGGQMITELLLPGDVCGALCALDSCPYPVSAQTVTPAEYAKLGPDEFFRLSQDFPQLQRCSLEGCATKIRHQRAMMASIALERIPQRLWKVFHVLAERLGETVPDGLQIPFPFSRQEVADMIGATPETVTRTFTRAKKDGELLESEALITLLGMTRLEQIAERAAL